jgi:hypothetical protein
MSHPSFILGIDINQSDSKDLANATEIAERNK